MKTYDFTLVLASGTELTEDLAESLCAAGCRDATAWQSEGVVYVGFDRAAESLEQAIRSAIADVQKTGCTVAKAEIDVPTLQGT
jgi:hypothetical protein